MSQESQCWASSRRFKKLLTDLQCELGHVKGRIIFKSMFNHIVLCAQGNKEQCEYYSQIVANYARKVPRGHWSFLVRGSEKKWYGTYTDKPDGSWDQTSENMMANFSEFRSSDILCLQCLRGELRSKGYCKKSIHLNGSDENIELLLRTLILRISSVCTEP